MTWEIVWEFIWFITPNMLLLKKDISSDIALVTGAGETQVKLITKKKLAIFVDTNLAKL